MYIPPKEKSQFYVLCLVSKHSCQFGDCRRTHKTHTKSKQTKGSTWSEGWASPGSAGVILDLPIPSAHVSAPQYRFSDNTVTRGWACSHTAAGTCHHSSLLMGTLVRVLLFTQCALSFIEVYIHFSDAAILMPLKLYLFKVNLLFVEIQK